MNSTIAWIIVGVLAILGFLLQYLSKLDKKGINISIYILVGFLVSPSIISFIYGLMFGLYTLPEYLAYSAFMFILVSPVSFLFTGMNLILRGRRYILHGMKLLGYSIFSIGILSLPVALFILYYIND